MFNLLSTFKPDKITQKFIDEIPPHMLMTKQEMMDEVAMEYIAGDMTYEELVDEHDIINEMYGEDE